MSAAGGAGGLRLKVAATLFGVAAVGFAAGLVLGRRDAGPPDAAISWVANGPGAREASLQTMPPQRLFDAMDLTPGQRRSVDSILAVGNEQLDASSTVLLAEIKATVAEAHRAIRTVLDSAQIAQLESMLSQLPVFEIRRDTIGR